MTTQTEALKLALEALEDRVSLMKWQIARDAVKEALAQPEQCKYGQEPKSCTSSPMDCQCAIDATLAQPEQEPDYAWPTIEDYENEVGFSVGDAFKMGWSMARTTNDLFTQMAEQS